MKKKILSLLLTMSMVVSLLSTAVMAGGSPVRIVETGTSYGNVQTAVDNAENGQTIQLNTVCTENVVIPTGKTVAINLNGNVLNGTGEDSVITIESGANLTLDDTSTEKTGKVTGGSATKGGGVYNNGTFTMSGGTITGNAATSYGGGVYVFDGSKFTMSGGTISDNTSASSGGGGYVASDGTLNMNGGSISENSASKSGAEVSTYNGTIDMTAGTISNNKADNGSGVFDNGTFNMSGGTITENIATSDGGVLVNAESTFNMQDGSITGNSATHNGGGVYVNSIGTFEMNGGRICSNYSSGAGGIYNSPGAVMKLLAAEDKTIEVSGNEAEKWEGGIANWGEMHLSGKVIIKDNVCKESEYPINLATNNAIIIDGELAGSKIVITHAIKSTDKQDIGLLTSGYSTKSGGTNLNDFFCYEGPDSFVMILNNSKELEVMNIYDVTNGTPAGDKDRNNGCLTIDKDSAVADEIVNVTVEPNSGYQLRSLTVNQTDEEGPNETPITPTQDSQDKTKYTFTMPAYAVTVTAEFEEIPHIHEPVKVDGQAATEMTAGWKDYYKCACGTLFEDAQGTTPIDDFEAWKAEGGAGYIAKIPPLPIYTVTFNIGEHGTQVASQNVEEGNKATEPTTPSEDGYSFDGWYSDKEYKKAFNFDTAVTEDIIVYAKWTCLHKNTEVKDAKDASLTVEGYTGDTYCKDCGEKLETGKAIPTLTPEPTPSSEPTPTPTLTVPPTTPTPAPELNVGDFVNRCYEVALGRTADKEGYEYWVSNLNDGQACGAQVGFGFIFSSEYANKNTTNEQFVTDMYSMFFGREADEAGYNYWLEQLNAGTATREQVFAGFANSEEFYNLCNKYGVVSGAYIEGVANDQQGGVNCFVARLYKVCLNRLPDMGGQAGWVQKLLNGEVSGSSCAYGFVFSPE
ncbi:MAG: DUF4214 domain-containing protein, partial [Clostridia bacterium]|nr:DUF4214 domain-containing protein [Clostridia bacterium]